MLDKNTFTFSPLHAPTLDTLIIEQLFPTCYEEEKYNDLNRRIITDIKEVVEMHLNDMGVKVDTKAARSKALELWLDLELNKEVAHKHFNFLYFESAYDAAELIDAFHYVTEEGEQFIIYLYGGNATATRDVVTICPYEI